VVHAVSATFQRFEHMSPPAAGMALLLHVLVAAFLIWAPTHHPDEPEDPIEVTMEAPPPPPPPPEPKPEPKPETKPEVQKPPPPVAAAKPPPPPPASMYTPFQPAAPVDKKNEGAKRPTDAAPEAKPVEKIEEAAPEKSDAPQQALAQPPAPAPSPAPEPPPLEKELPPVEVPPAPLTSRDFPKAAPPPEPKPQPKPPVQAQPQRQQPPQTALAPSPLSRLPPRGAPPPSSREGTEPAPSPFVNPADVRARNDIANNYLGRVVNSVSTRQSFTADASWLRLVVGVRVVIARDGRLVDISVARSSGNPEADKAVLQIFRATSPFAPLPPELPGNSFTFSLPFGFVPR
jgi:TonB family protein